MNTTRNTDKYTMNAAYQLHQMDARDDRDLFKMYRDALLRSPTGEPWFHAHEIGRLSMLEAQESEADVIAAAEAIVDESYTHAEVAVNSVIAFGELTR